ncbi:MAG: NADP-dependent oxidoreductase [Gemmatimonadota bacterium]
MKAWFIRRYGGPEVLELGNVPEPAVGSHDVLVAIRAASVNPIDWKTRRGDTKRILKHDFPFVLGNDLSGVVEQTGAAVSRFSVGDEVFGRPNKSRIGTFAERIAVNADEIALKPKRCNHAAAASIPLAGLTAWQALTEAAPVLPGHKVLIQAGAGGVGTLAIQLAKHLGAYVATTASAPKHELVRSLGADQPIDYRSEDFSRILTGYDMVLDATGGETLHRAFSVLRPGGTVVGITGPPDADFAREWNLGPLARIAVYFMGRSVQRRARRAQCRYKFLLMRSSGSQLEEICRLVDDNVIEPVLDRVFPFRETDAAIRYAETGRATGKVVIEHP